MGKFLWKPSDKRKEESLLEDFSKLINLKSNYNFKNLWKWSIDHPEEFWSKFWDYSKIIGDKGQEIIKYDKIFNKTETFTSLIFPSCVDGTSTLDLSLSSVIKDSFFFTV
jgi:hypothetical protein